MDGKKVVGGRTRGETIGGRTEGLERKGENAVL